MEFIQNTNRVVMPLNVNLDRNRPRKVVYYGRVSTEHEAQISALENQLQWYDDQTKYHPNWTVLRKYIDEGITGTQAKKRPSFMQMVSDAKKKKFDLIVTREVCRFARNTVDTLVITRELKSCGVEVYFVEDNIWTMDGDGELRLSLMATLAQEESRKVSERVRAGQKISRDKGVLYGNGNIIGYDLDKNLKTYVINEEQAKTVKLIFDLYEQGYGEMKICRELTLRGIKDGWGHVSWSCGKISRILRNATYMGYKVYLKSFCSNYLDQRRIKNPDEDSYLYVKGDFEPIISEEQFYKCKELRKKKSNKIMQPDGTVKTFGFKLTDAIFLPKIRCRCGSRLRKNIWHRNKEGNVTYGYRCYTAINKGTKRLRKQSGLSTEGYCDGPMVGDWKLNLMADVLKDEIMPNSKDIIEKCLGIYERNFTASVDKNLIQNDKLNERLDRLKTKKDNIIEMRALGDIDREKYISMMAEVEEEIAKTEASLNSTDSVVALSSLDIDTKVVEEKLNEMFSCSEKERETFVENFVSKIVVDDKDHYEWTIQVSDREEKNMGIEVTGRQNTDKTLCFTLPNEKIDSNLIMHGLPHRLTSKTRESNV